MRVWLPYFTGYIHSPGKPGVLCSATPNLLQVSGFEDRQGVMDHTPWIDVGSQWSVYRHTENVFLLSNNSLTSLTIEVSEFLHEGKKKREQVAGEGKKGGKRKDGWEKEKENGGWNENVAFFPPVKQGVLHTFNILRPCMILLVGQFIFSNSSLLVSSTGSLRANQ